MLHKRSEAHYDNHIDHFGGTKLTMFRYATQYDQWQMS